MEDYSELNGNVPEFDGMRQSSGESLAGCAARHMIHDANMFFTAAVTTGAVAGPAAVVMESAGLAVGLGVAVPVAAITGAGIDFAASAVECYGNRR